MNITIYANCQKHGLKYFLKDFFPDAIFNLMRNYDIIKNKEILDIEVLKKTDIFIYQPINKKHGIYSTDNNISENIISYLPSNCIKIAFPYIYCDALWSSTHYADIDALCINNIISPLNLDYEKRWNENINILKEKEKICDIKVCDFIIENIRKHRLFWTQNHPTTCIYVHCVNQILKILNIDKQLKCFDYPEFINNSHDGAYQYSVYDKNYWKFEFIK